MELDCSKYLSIDNGKGLLIGQNDALVLKQYGIDYMLFDSMSELILIVGKYIDENEDCEELEDVLTNLVESHYYNETKK